MADGVTIDSIGDRHANIVSWNPLKVYLIMLPRIEGEDHKMNKTPEISKIAIYETEDGQTKLQVKIEGETVWLAQDQMAELFEKGRTTITEHIQNTFKEGGT